MTATNKSKSSIPLAGLAKDGWSSEDQATATCYCGTVQLIFVSIAYSAYQRQGCIHELQDSH